MNKTRTQKVAIVIIKLGNEILLQENQKWKDLSFIGGKYEEKDLDLITTAYREVSEELSLIPFKDFTLSSLNPETITIEKFSDRTNEITRYVFHIFLLSAGQTSREKISKKGNYWVRLDEILNAAANTFRLSAIVVDIIPKLMLTNLESFLASKE